MPAVGEIHLPPTREVTLANGAHLVLAEKHDLPLIAFHAFVRGGSITDPPGKEGLAALTGDMLRKGAGKRSARDISEATDGAGASFGSGASYEIFWVSGEFLARDEALMLDLLRDVLRHPLFPDSEFVKLSRQTVDELRSEKDDPWDVLGDYGLAFLFPDHPYGRPVDGDEATVARITRDDVLACYRERFGGDRLIVTVVGDFDSRRMESRLKAAFEDWPRAAAALPTVPDPPSVHGRRVLLVDKPDATQTYFWMGNRGIARRDPDRDIVDVANTAFGGRFTSILNSELRTRSGLTYGVRSRTMRLGQPGSVAISSFTKTDSTRRAMDLALQLLGRLRGQGLDTTMVASVKSYLSGLYPTHLETSGQIASTLADLAYHGLPVSEATDYVERIEGVDPKSILPVIRRVYPAPEDLSIVMIGNAARIRKVARTYGPVREVRFDQPLLQTVHEVSARAR
jgi:predicted Zn-dependent peptidase